MSNIPFDSGGNNGPVFQSNLGTLNSTHTQQDRNWNHGYLAFGKVLNVYPKRYTADVEIFQTSDKLHSTHEQEGRHGCKIGVSTAGFSDLYQAPYGEIVPIQRGNIVLVGFLKNTKEQPIILRVFHDTTEEVGSFNFRNILSNYFSAYSNIGDILDYLKITPIQDFLKIDRFGNVELSSHTKSFFVATESNLIDDKFDYEDLSPKFPKDKTVVNPLAGISDLYDLNSTGQSYYNWGDDAKRQLSVETVHVDEKYSKPKKYMAVFRDNYTDSKTNWLRLIVDAAHTSFRILKVQQKANKNTYFDVTEDGTIKIRRQLDTRLLFDPDVKQTEINPTQNPCNIYSEIQLLSDGTIKLETVDRTLVTDPNLENGFSSESETGADESKDFPHTLITISPKGGDITIETNSKIAAYAKSGIDIKSKGNIDITSDKDINMTSKGDTNITSKQVANITSIQGINVTSDDDVKVDSKTTTRISATDTVNMFAPDMYLTGAMDMKGSISMLGAVDVVGDANFIGRHRVNMRGAILDGDIDTWGDINLEFFCNYVLEMVESYGIKFLVSEIGANSKGSSSVMGMINADTNGFLNLPGMSFNGTASKQQDVVTGTLIDENSPYYAAFLEFCEENNCPPNSMSSQLTFLDKFLKENDTDLATLGDNTLNPLNGVVEAVNTLWSKFDHNNTLSSDIHQSLNKSQEFDLSEDQINILITVCADLELVLVSDNLDSTLVNRVSRHLLGNVANTETIIHEGDVVKQNNKEQNDNEQNNDDNGGEHHVQLPDDDENNENENTKYTVASIEDALHSVQQYFRDNLINQIKQLEQNFDEKTGMNTQQYAKSTRTTKVNDKENDKEIVSRPSTITNTEQYIDRTIKRYVFINCERLVNQINASWKYYIYNA